MNTKRTKSRNGWWFAILAILAVPGLQAQPTISPAPKAAAAAEAEDVIVLTPFEVNTTTDKGYAATDTLAGSRLRMELRDVAASITVVNKDFMNDIAANTLEDLLTYTAGTEIEGISGNFSGSGFNPGGFTELNGASRRVQSEVRVRGLSNGIDQTRDYFITDAPMDNYNLDRIEVLRGPNAILFGLGKPGGIANSGLIKAQLTKTKTEVKTQIDQESSKRIVFDHNQVLIKDVLALRFAALLSNKRYQIKPAHKNDERYYLTATWRPWKGGQLRVSTEKAKEKTNKPYIFTPMNSVSWWIDMGKPYWNPMTGTGAYLMSDISAVPLALRPFKPDGSSSSDIPTPGYTSNTNRPGTLVGGVPQSSGLSIIGEDPRSSRLGIANFGDARVQAFEFGGNTRSRVNPITATTNPGAYANTAAFDMGDSVNYMRQKNAATGLYHETTNPTGKYQPTWYNFWKDQHLMDSNIFDFYHQSLDGPNKREWAFWKTYNASFTQDIGRNAGIEISYDWQRLDNGYIQPLQFRQPTITIDLNRFLVDGTNNDNFARPMFHTALGQSNTGSTEREAYRATGYYKLDFTQMKTAWLAKLLGRHVFTGSHTTMDRDIYSLGGRLDTIGTDYAAAKLINSPLDRKLLTTDNPNQVFQIGDTERHVMRQSYLGASLTHRTSLDGYSLQGVSALQNLDGLDTIGVRYYERPIDPTKATPVLTAPFTVNPQNWKNRNFSLVKVGEYDTRKTTTGGSHNYEKTASQSIVSTNYFWDDTLVTTLGYRWDRFSSFEASNSTATIDGLRNITPEVWQMLPKKIIKSNKFNYGLVLHTPPFLRGKLPLGADVSLTYNQSDNFSPGAQKYDVYNNLLDPVTGKTEEWSVLLTLFSNKLQLRAIQYETSQVGVAAGSFLEIQNLVWRRLQNQVQWTRSQTWRDQVVTTFGPSGLATLAAWDAFEQTAPAQALFNTYGVTLPTGPIGAAVPQVDFSARITDIIAPQDQVAKGYEFDVTYNPTPQWRIAMNAGKQKTVNTNTGIASRRMFNSLEPYWASFGPGGAGALPTVAATNITTSSGNLAGDWVDINAKMKAVELLDGGAAPEQRGWRFNAQTNYTFKGGFLDNVQIGGAFKWQARAVIGFHVIDGPDTLRPGIIDVTNPYWAPAETNIDAWIGYSRVFSSKKIKWSVRLNVKNIGEGNRLIAVSAQPDGTIDTARMSVPQQWTLSNSFEF